VKHKQHEAMIQPEDHVHYEGTLHTIQHIISEEGIHGLYAGINGALIGVASTNFAYFYWYSVVRTLYLSSQKLPQPPSTAIELSLGAVAGAIAQIFTIPVAVITTRQQTQRKKDRKGLFETGREVIESDDGWTGLWRGLKASLVLVVNPAITYGAYQRLRERLFPGRASLRPWESFRTCLIPCFELRKSLGFTNANYVYSLGRNVEGSCNHCHAALDCCKSGVAVEASTPQKWSSV
jgi:hypothetical protein